MSEFTEEAHMLVKTIIAWLPIWGLS